MSTLDTAVALCTLEEVKNYLSLKRAGADEQLVTLINAVSTDCQRRYCLRNFLDTDYTDEKYDGHGDAFLHLKNYPVTALDSITPFKNATALTVVDDEFEFNAETGEVHLLGGRYFPKSYREILVTYSAGYADTDAIPADLKLSILQAVAHRFEEFDKKTFSVTRQDKGEAGSAEYIEGEYPAFVINVWKHYARAVYG